MSIVFPCAVCQTTLRVADEMKDTKVRCRNCSTVNAVPVESTQPGPFADSATVQEDDAPADHRESLATEPRQPSRERAATRRDKRSDRHESASPKKSGIALPLILAVCGLWLVLMIGGAVTLGWFLLSPAPGPIVAVSTPNDIPRPIPQEDNFPPPDRAGDAKPAFPRDRGLEPKGKEPPQPPGAVALKLVGGKAELDIDPPSESELSYRFFSPAGKVYYFALGQFAQARLRVVGPTGETDDTKNIWDSRPLPELAFETKQAGDYTVHVRRTAPGQGVPLKLTVREMDGSEPLPFHLRFRTGGFTRAGLAEVKKLNIYDKQLASAAFAPDGKFFYMSHGDGTLSYWTDPKKGQDGSFATGDKFRNNLVHLFAMAVDHKGRVYAQQVVGKRDIRDTRAAGDISVWERLVPDGENKPLPAPDRTLRLGGIVQRMLSSPDGKHLYFLDVHNRKVCRIDADAGKIDKEIDTISQGAVSFCLTADGKRMYVASSANKVDVIDAEAMTLLKTVSFAKGTPRDIAATNAGVVFMASWGDQDNHVDRGSAFMLDLTRKELPAEAKTISIPMRRAANVVRVLPDQRWALFSADQQILSCSIPARPTLDAVWAGNVYVWSFNLPGDMVISPDSRTLLLDLGRVLSVGR